MVWLASAPKVATRTVKFFRLAAMLEDRPYPLPNLPWQELMRKYRARVAEKRLFSQGGRDYRVAPSDIGDRHLVFLKYRAETDPLTEVDLLSGDYSEVPASSRGKIFADSSPVIFVGTAPVFGIVRPSVASPHASAVAHWLTDLHPFSADLHFAAYPLVSEPDLQKLSGAFGVKRVHLRVPFSRMNLSESALGRQLSALAGRFNDGVIEVAIGTGRANPKRDAAESMLELTQDIAGNLGDGAAADAVVVHEVPSQAKSQGKKPKMKLEGETVDLIRHEFATSFTIRVSSDRAMIDASLHHMDALIAEQQSALLGALEAVSDESSDGEDPRQMVDDPSD